MSENVLAGPATWIASARRMVEENYVTPSSTPSGGGPQGPGLHARVTTLETELKGLTTVVVRVEAAVGQINSKLDALATREQVAGLPSRDTVRNWGIGLIVALIASVLAVGGLLLAASGNQLSAFQAGLSTVEATVAARQPLPPVLPLPSR